jgi:protein PhnA
MAHGKSKVGIRDAAVSSLLGKDLSRRARARCELCEESTSLLIFEVPPIAEDPEIERALMICERCERAVEGGRQAPPPDELRFLTTAMWSPLLPCQLTAVRTLRRLDTTWARDALDGLYLDPEVEAQL